MPFYDLFALDMQRVLNDEIVSVFDTLEPVALSTENIGVLAEHEANNPHATKGLYILHHQGVAVYVGKADDSLRSRLEDHRVKLGSRLNLNVADMGFRCLYLDKNWSALTHERPLIERFEYQWNATGFGNHDPGRNRDKTELRANHFDRLYPIDANLPLTFAEGPRTVATALQEVREQLPFLFRHATKPGFRPSRSHPDYHANSVSFLSNETVRSAVGKIVDALGEAWQVTFLYGYLILYREHHDYQAASAFLFKRGGQDWVAPVAEPAGDAEDEGNE
jgi:hypothetical protein